MADLAMPLSSATDAPEIPADAPAKDLLRFITCGSVDDGKSTLIGRLLHDSRALLADQLDALARDSARSGTQGGSLDFALLLDGLESEREQGITIDVAYRFFETGRRRFIVADCPGHEQYTRNMVTGASTADLAIILVDARHGLQTQTRRHSWIVRLLGVRHVVLAVTKMDLVGFQQEPFEAIAAAYREFASALGMDEVAAIPLSGLGGDNVVAASAAMPWYRGPTLLARLETVPLEADAQAARPFRMPVQWVNRPDGDFRGFAGRIAAGAVQPGDTVRLLPSGRTSVVRRIVTFDGDLERAAAGQSVTLTLADAIDCPRGTVLAAAGDPPQLADQFEATLVWMDEAALVPGRSYLLKLASQTVPATVRVPKYRIDVSSREHLAAKTLAHNEIGVAEIATDRPLVFEPYADSRALGGFILIDRQTQATVACGMLHFALRRSQNLHWQAIDVSRETRSRLKNQTPAVLWFTGLSGAGKSTIANLVDRKLTRMHRHSFLLDGDNVRHGLNRDLGFTEADRIENIRRVGEVAKLMADAGLIVITAFISPFRAERDMVRAMMAEGEFFEIFVDTPLAEAERRDVKGLYAKARAGLLRNFTGIDSPYEPPEAPELRIDTMAETPEAAADRIVEMLLGPERS
jgi:bifunctional enzyme CysN/CysC